MKVQSFPASRPVTAAGPGDAALVPDGRAEGPPGAAVAGGVPGFGVAGGGLEGVTVDAVTIVPGQASPNPQTALINSQFGGWSGGP
jgi:hypothetical protein